MAHVVEEETGLVWSCEFCGHYSRVPKTQAGYDLHFLASKPFGEAKRKSCVACIDVSGSMKNRIWCAEIAKRNKEFLDSDSKLGERTLLATMLRSIDESVEVMATQEPETSFGLVEFADWIKAHGDCTMKDPAFCDDLDDMTIESLQDLGEICAPTLQRPLSMTRDKV